VGNLKVKLDDVDGRAPNSSTDSNPQHSNETTDEEGFEKKMKLGLPRLHQTPDISPLCLRSRALRNEALVLIVEVFFLHNHGGNKTWSAWLMCQKCACIHASREGFNVCLSLRNKVHLHVLHHVRAQRAAHGGVSGLPVFPNLTRVAVEEGYGKRGANFTARYDEPTPQERGKQK